MSDRIKEAIKKLFSSRMHVLIVISCVVFSILIGRVFYLQIVKGQYYLDNYKLQILKTREVPGTRGNIYDRNGELLAYNDLAYSVIIEDNLYGPDKNEILNGILEEVIRIVESHGDSVINSFGIVLDSSGQFEFSQTNETLKLRFIADVFGEIYTDNLKPEERNATPDDIIKYLCTDEQYGYDLDMDNMEKDYLLKMINLRYAINLNSFQKYIPTTLATDVSDETVAEIMENLDKLEGVSIAEDSMRRYVDSQYFASVIGYTGKISQEEYDALDKEQKKQYSLTDTVGKSGMEQTMEAVLKGKKGKMKYYTDSVGKVTETVSTENPEAGNDVYLTLDKNLQAEAYQILEEKLAGIVLAKLQNVYNYDPANEDDSKHIIIPADDAFNAFIANEIIDDGHFGAPDAYTVETQVYDTFNAKKEQVISDLIAEIRNSGAVPFKDLSNEWKAYIEYVTDTVLTKNTEILMWDAIDKNDEVFKQWREEESINLNKYLNYAISKNWIDTGKLSTYITESKYYDSAEIFEGILTFLESYIRTDVNFDKLLYKYLIKSGGITGNQIAAIVYEQEVLPWDEATYNALVSGETDAYYWLRDKISSLEITPGQLALEPCTGSVVVSDPNTGEVLACVSYPGYDNNRLANNMDSKYYNQLVTGLSRPFYNNATQERTAPGSTYKMVTSVAGLTEGLITGDTVITCTGDFTKVTPSPKCWVYPGAHGGLNVVGALDVSCNDFFYEVGYELGTDENGEFDSDLGVKKLAKYAKKFGLDEKTGIEIPESEPQSSDEYAVLSAIGQGTNNFTVSQLNRYVATIANRGTLYNLTLLNKTTDVNGKLIKKYEPVIADTIDDVSSNTWDLVHSGMISMIQSTPSFNGLGIEMAGKTGTAQQSEVHPDHGLFVGFAPAEAPEIALSVRIANGYSSSYAAEIGRDVVKSYFDLDEKSEYIKGAAAELGTAAVGD